MKKENKNKGVLLNLEEELLKEIDEIAKKEFVNRTTIIRKALLDYLKDKRC